MQHLHWMEYIKSFMLMNLEYFLDLICPSQLLIFLKKIVDIILFNTINIHTTNYFKFSRVYKCHGFSHAF